MESSWSIEHYEAALKEANDAMTELRTLLGANEGESTGDALHRYTSAVQLGCALKLEQRAKELSASSVGAVFAAIEGVPSSVIVAALIGGATLLRQGVETETGQQLTRYPCSATCTHDDAATPGHPERVKERSEAVKREVECLPFDGCRSDREREVYIRGYRVGGEMMEEAMRAACLDAVQDEKDEIGLTAYQRDRLKSAIEGAAP